MAGQIITLFYLKKYIYPTKHKKILNFITKGQFYQQRNAIANTAKKLRGDPADFNMYPALEQNTRGVKHKYVNIDSSG